MINISVIFEDINSVVMLMILGWVGAQHQSLVPELAVEIMILMGRMRELVHVFLEMRLWMKSHYSQIPIQL